MRVWGKTGEALLDWWTVVHISWWLVWGANAESQNYAMWWAFPAGMLLAFAWEVVESLAGEKWGWFRIHRPEGFWNRWISDPVIATPLGWWAGVLGVRYLGS
jgi:hypothetical protein